MLAGGGKIMDGGVRMRKIYCTICLIICLFWASGCRLLESAVSDIQGWDVSACVSGLDTCWELFFDNADKFEDGFVEAMENLQ